MEESVLEISIPGTRSIRNRYTEYEIVCITNNTGFGKCYSRVFRRYSDFLRLHTKLRCFVKMLPEFPKKRWNKMHRNTIDERMQMFAVYLKFVCDYILKNKKDAEKISADVVAFVQDCLRISH